MRRALAAGALTAFCIAAGCRGQTEQDCIDGRESCACLSNATCNNGLNCVNNVCNAVPTGGTSGIAGTGGASSGGGAGAVTSTDPVSEYCNGLIAGSICSQTTASFSLTSPNVLLVIDDSGSMRDAPSSVSSSTKWSILNQTLASVLPVYQSRINFGLELFPYAPGGLDTSTPNGACNVPSGTINLEIAPGAANISSITSLLLNQVPAGGTPTSKALQEAYRYFTQGGGRNLTATSWVVLITDGGPNCNPVLQCDANACTQNLAGACASGVGTSVNCCDTSTTAGAAAQANLDCLDEAATVKQLQTLKTAGIGTFVIGLPGSEAYALALNFMAMGGGQLTASYFAVSAGNTEGDLRSALSMFFNQLTYSCDGELRTTPASSRLVQVVKNCQRVPALPNNSPAWDGGIVGGFYIDYNRSPAHLVLTGDYCDAALASGASQLDVIDDCLPPP